MLEIIALYYLTRYIGNVAMAKGLKPGKWKLYTILAWISAEIIGAVFAISIFGKDNLFAVYSITILSAFGGYLYIKATIEKKPDAMDDSIHHIGADDLQPPRKDAN